MVSLGYLVVHSIYQVRVLFIRGVVCYKVCTYINRNELYLYCIHSVLMIFLNLLVYFLYFPIFLN